MKVCYECGKKATYQFGEDSHDHFVCDVHFARDLEEQIPLEMLIKTYKETGIEDKYKDMVINKL